MARRAIKPRKQKKIKLSRLAVKLTEQRGYGPEPEESRDYIELGDGAYGQDLNWYSRFTDDKDSDDYIAAAMLQKGYNAKQVAAMRRANKPSITLASISRMILRNSILQAYSDAWWTKEVNSRVKLGEGIHEARVESGAVVSIRDRTENKALDFIGDIDDVIDQVWVEKLKLDEVEMFKILQALELKPAHAKILEAHYKQIIEKMESDWAAYPREYNKKDIKVLAAMYAKVIEACNSISKSVDAEGVKNKIQRAANKVAKEKKNIFKSVGKELAAVTKLKYQLVNNELGLTSVKPQSIIGAHVLVTLNTKYNVLTIFRAETVEGLGVKGTTITGFSETESKSKRAGRATALTQIKEFPDMTRAAAIKHFELIKGSEVQLRGRTSEDTVLIKAFK